MKMLVGFFFVLFLMGGCGKEKPAGSGLPPSSDMKPEKTIKSSIATRQDQPASTVSKNTADGSEFTYDIAGRRDPFRSLLFVGSKPKGGTPLQQRVLAEIKLVGIVWEKNGFAAMVETPDGKGYTLRPGTLVGPGGGKVKIITEKSVIIEETYTDFTGAKKSKETVIGLRTKEEELE